MTILASNLTARTESPAGVTTPPHRVEVPLSENGNAAAARKGRPRSSTADDAILSATRALLADRGWASLTIGDVAVRAGVAKTTLYRRWASKQELVMAAVADMLDSLELPDDGDLRSDMESVVRQFAALLTRPEMQTALMGLVADSTRDPELRRRVREAIVDPQKRLVVEGRARARARGETTAADAIDVDLVFDVISGTVVQHMLVSAEPAGEEWVSRFVAFVTAGLVGLGPDWGSEPAAPRSAAEA
ncbi:TetR/AcrR family transcriptional regulator [Yinghuangia seranimata]|uniref:TetR/AcrR family transcriptional regulator n=1 Tax=Yinghuangia seranimata TaxID=408067 RepID=UPI00248D349D|nr:TetR/AcrR family transcriptional regulator [Yinghuangia seranimata]MDI2128246.1 TetR/AcrR family transcriptional regulator [Yinghuangia seranimata]